VTFIEIRCSSRNAYKSKTVQTFIQANLNHIKTETKPVVLTIGIRPYICTVVR